MNDAIVVALVTGCFGILIPLVQKGRKENIRDHGYVVERLDALHEDIQYVDEDLGIIEAKIDGHINDHAVGNFGARKSSGKKQKNK